MKKSEFIDLVAEKAEMSKAAAARAVDAIFDTAGGAISEAVRSAGHLSIPGFGKFTSRTRAAREGRNPRTGAAIDIPERTSVAFSPGKGLREVMAGEGGGKGAAKKSRTAGAARKSAGGPAARKTATAKKSTATAERGGTAKKTGAAKKGEATKGATKGRGGAR